MRNDFMRGVGIDFQFPAESTHGGKSVAGTQLSGHHGFFGGVDDLFVDGGARPEVDVERNQARTITNRKQ